MTEPTDAEMTTFTDAFDWEGWISPALAKRAFARAVLAKWGTPPAGAGEPWGACVSGRVFVGKLPEHARKLAEAENLQIQWLYTTPQPTQAQAGAVPLTDEQVERAAKKIAECMDYPWGHMPTIGQEEMRIHARAVLEAAHGIKGGQHGADT